MTSERKPSAARPMAPLQLTWRPYAFRLPRDMVTSQGAWNVRRGWLLRLEAADGHLGWGEAALPPTAEGRPAGRAETPACSADLTHLPPAETPCALPSRLERGELEERLPRLALPLACALGMALAELDGLGAADRAGWLTAPPSALLLPAGAAALAALEQALEALSAEPGNNVIRPAPGDDRPASPDDRALSVKWKVAAGEDAGEREVLEELLARLPVGGRLRLDANGGWDRSTAWRWATRLAGEARLDWLEQPLRPEDHDGLRELATTVPVALDESLRHHPERIPCGWPGWQVRRPLLEGDPRPLLAALQTGTPRLMLSTALETGIGRRFLEHLAGLQALGPTPTAPGLAPGWRPGGALFSPDPGTVWEAAG